MLVGDYLFDDGPDNTAVEVKYHMDCYTDYLNSVRTSKEQQHTKLKKIASKEIFSYVQRVVVGKNTPVFAPLLLQIYQDSFISTGGKKRR